MIRIGLLGEAPHDTTAIANLLSQQFSGQARFFGMVDDIPGSQIEMQRVKHQLRKEFELRKPHLVIFIRDLDALEGDAAQTALRKSYFSDFRKVVDGKAIYLLNIYAIEALILADIEAFNQLKGTSIPHIDDPMKVPRPEEFLKAHSNYQEGQLAEIFAKLRLNLVLQNCRYFRDFFHELLRQTAAISPSMES